MILRSLIKRFYDPIFRAVVYSDYLDGKRSLPFVILFGILNKFYDKIMLLPLEWLDENKTGFIKTLLPEILGFSYGPFIHGFSRLKQVLIPAVNLYIFKNARISATSSSILLNYKIIIERLEGVDPQKCCFVSGHVIMHGNNIALVNKRKTEYLDKGIFLGGNGSFNYYHWMIEILPKLQFLQNLNHEYHAFPLLVSEDVTFINTFREALNLIVKDQPLVILDKSKSYFVGRLLYINAPNNCPFNLRRNHKIKISDFIFRRSSICFLRDRLRPDLRSSVKIAGNRFFFARRSVRRNYNQDEIYDIFKRNGFVKVFMEELSLNNQIDLVSSAEMIAGPSGAAWTNLIFCSEGTKCLCWMAEESNEFSVYSNLAKIVCADLRYVTYRTKAISTGELYYMDYHLDGKEIEKVLFELMSTCEKPLQREKMDDITTTNP
jgi:capsular polysaccharide biosynthesis protein